ncbi:hypothetical protein J2809_000103 [Arthrobacter pascens]|uniref:hypothetical protein n=1 Tax=Arthrobacter pascens TaxID=1677 RepID=UPI00285B6325|nr:hypothetical protein [Arthrobacter pascens]MDR6555772.1 hypothetical protein [Arthrobacter pascens]
MGQDGDLQVWSLAELAAGDEIEAWHRGRLAYRGRVVSTLADIDLFWIIDARTGARRLLDLEQLSVRRMPAGRPAAAVGKSGPDVARKPASAVPDPAMLDPTVPDPAVVNPAEPKPPAPKPGPGTWRQVTFVEAG